MHNFRRYTLSLDTVRAIARRVADIARHDPDLARQARRALNSIHLNIAESINAEGKLRNARLRTALGSTNEVIACLDVADVLGYAHADAKELDMLQHVRATLLRCVSRKR